MHTAAAYQYVINSIDVSFIKQNGTWDNLHYDWGGEDEFQDKSYHTISGLRTSGTQYMNSTAYLDNGVTYNTIFTITYKFFLGESWNSDLMDMSINDVFLSNADTSAVYSLPNTYYTIFDESEYVYLMLVFDTRDDYVEAGIDAGYSYGFGYSATFPAVSSGQIYYKILQCEAIASPDLDPDGGDNSGGDNSGGDTGGSSGGTTGGTVTDTAVQEAIDRQTLLIRYDIEQMNSDISSGLDDVKDSVEQGKEEIVDAIQNQGQLEKEEANSSGNKFIDEAMSTVDIMPADDITSALGNLVNLVSYEGTNCVFSLPRCQIPLMLNGSSMNINLWEEQRIDFNDIILNHSVMTTYVYPVTKFLFSLGALYYFWREVSSLILGGKGFSLKSRSGNSSETEEE